MSDSNQANLISCSKESLDNEEILKSRKWARGIVLLARKKGESVLKNVEMEAKKIREETHKKGYEDGFSEGVCQGKKKFNEECRQKMAEILENIERAELEYYKKLGIMLETLTPRILDTVVEIVREIVLHQVEHDDEFVIRAVREAVKNLAGRDRVILSAHKDEVKKILENKEDIMSKSGLVADLEVYPGEGIMRGGIKISSESGLIDATIDSKLEVVREVVNNR